MYTGDSKEFIYEAENCNNLNCKWWKLYTAELIDGWKFEKQKNSKVKDVKEKLNNRNSS
jgi:hypothetical protein